MKITIKIDKYQDLEVYKSKPETCIYNAIKKELTFDANVASGKEWRLIHNDNFIDLVEGYGTTTTFWDIFTGTEEDCLRIMEEYNWEKPEWEDEFKRTTN